MLNVALAFWQGVAIYKQNYGALDSRLGISATVNSIETRCWADNLANLDDLRLKMLAFQLTGDFSKFAYNADLLKGAHQDLCAKLGRDI